MQTETASLAKEWLSFFILCCWSRQNNSDPYSARCDHRSPAVNGLLCDVETHRDALGNRGCFWVCGRCSFQTAASNCTLHSEARWRQAWWDGLPPARSSGSNLSAVFLLIFIFFKSWCSFIKWQKWQQSVLLVAFMFELTACILNSSFKK